MNSPARALKKRRAALDTERASEVERDDARRETLRALRLKTVIRENHGAARDDARGVRARLDARTANLYATCGGNVVTVYDDEHFGDHAAIVAQYAHETTAHQVGGEITCACWARSEEREGKRDGDDEGGGARVRGRDSDRGRRTWVDQCD